jgi:probable rRNA maturation factor
MTIYFEDEANIPFAFDMEKTLEKVVSCVKQETKCPYELEVSVTMVDRQTIREMNTEFRQIEKETDVLSFPMMEYDKPFDFQGEAFQESMVRSPETDEVVLGDIVLCSEVLKEQAKEYGHSELREFSFLVVHSMLHLFGCDHMEEEERIEMEDWQRKIMNHLGIER